LPPEPTDSDQMAVKTVALRFADGRTGQRRFAATARTNDLLDWVDAVFGMERETVQLVTLNGKVSLEWNEDDKGTTLEEAGLGKMVGLRVTEKKVAAAAAATDKSDDDSS